MKKIVHETDTLATYLRMLPYLLIGSDYRSEVQEIFAPYLLACCYPFHMKSNPMRIFNE